jgi:hypothetical protein
MDTTSKLRSLEAQAASQLSVLKQKVSAAEGSYDSLFSELKNLKLAAAERCSLFPEADFHRFFHHFCFLVFS